MRIKHGGKLSKAYFVSYMKLIMSTQNCSLEKSKQITVALVFGEERVGADDEVYQNFLQAYEELNQ